jgi:glycerate 2-kinase
MQPVATNELRQTAARLFRAAVASVEPRGAVRRALSLSDERLTLADAEVDLGAVERVIVIGAGKAACAMSHGVLDLLAPRIDSGTVTTRRGYASPLPGMEIWEAGHPVPDTYGMVGAAEALRHAHGAGENDLVICLISGGASALWPAPPPGVPLADLQRVTELLLRSGAPIEELNTVRKHLSRLSGGQLARAIHPARLLALVLSDVVDSRLDVIASGPTVPDPTTFGDALEIVRRREVDAPAAVLTYLQAGVAGDVPETPKPGDPALERAITRVIARNRDALDAASAEAEQLGLRARIVSDSLQGEARDAAYSVVGEIRRELRNSDGDRPDVLLWGGETTVTVRGSGLGGRNQELALAAALLLEGQAGFVLASVGTDGIDGPTDAAGAVIDGSTAARARTAGFDPVGHLQENDSHTLLQVTGDLVTTGPTGTNVNDIVIAVLGKGADGG